MDEPSDDVDNQKMHRSRFSGIAEMLEHLTTECGSAVILRRLRP